MNNIIVLPVLVPLLTAITLVFFRRYIHLQRSISVLALIITSGISIYVLEKIQVHGVLRLDFGGWKPPYGILFVADSFAMLLVAVGSFVAAICLMFAFGSIGRDLESKYFYSFSLFLVAGVNGSFLTGDLFNLFVCFEVLLVASYVLLFIAGGKSQLTASITYITVNVISSWFFLVSIGFLYGTVGTLNMAHLSERIAEAGQTPLLTTISLLFLLVFGIKAGLLLYIWLPDSYSVLPPAIAALFGALLTKVGIYAVFRFFTLLFYHEPQVTHKLIGILAVITIVGGCLGSIAYHSIQKVIVYNVVIAVGFIFLALAVSTEAALQGAIYYLMHDMIVKALLFMIGGMVVIATGTTRMEKMSGLIGNYPLLGVLYFITMLSLAGIPPFSGFIGKFLIGEGAIENGSYVLLAFAFLSSLLVLYSLVRVFLSCFWGETIIGEDEKVKLPASLYIPSVILTIGTIALGLGAEIFTSYVTAATDVLMNPKIYIEAVLNRN
ncbi:Na+/H+ antiporter subunit D [Aciduricibacillus chroicocephali]|uniref:Na+/H+ antiporter subunit D n=1 Tax=Aciduricibacillus chroicocephali TaxID=3054939 RepID=A0ABY9KYB2_9BACI|nr:Na+/H+ antiporter subunit D [Bacillaceae bacterium 44XB]